MPTPIAKPFISNKNLPRLLMGLALGLVLIAAIFAIIPFQDESLTRLLTTLSYPWLGATFLCTIGLWLTGAMKWHRYVKEESSEKTAPPLVFFTRSFAWQQWWGQLLPSSLAIIAGRSWSQKQIPTPPATSPAWKQGAKSGLIDQLIEFIFLCSLLPSAAAILLYHQDSSVYVPLMILGLLLGIPASLLSLKILRRLAPRLLPQTLPASLVSLSALRVILLVTRLACLAPALGLDIPIPHLIAATPVLSFILVIPLSPANLGIAEWSWIGLLTLTGTPLETAALYALGARVIVFIQQTLLLIPIEKAILPLSSSKTRIPN